MKKSNRQPLPASEALQSQQGDPTNIPEEVHRRAASRPDPNEHEARIGIEKYRKGDANNVGPCG